MCRVAMQARVNVAIIHVYDRYVYSQGPTINGVLSAVVNELKQILKRDFNKKMIESTAFKLFEVWWDEKKSEKSQAQGSGDNVVVVNNTTKEDVTKPQGLSSLLEQATPLGLNYDGFGLGIRASMPKMPSFRVSFSLDFSHFFVLCSFFYNVKVFCRSIWFSFQQVTSRVI